MAYEITLSRSADKEIFKLPISVQQRVENAIDSLHIQPRPSGVVKLKGEKDLYRIQVGNYRIIYSIDDDRGIIDIGYVRHRREVYRRRK